MTASEIPICAAWGRSPRVLLPETASMLVTLVKSKLHRAAA